jgi:hypothetical protein
MIVARLLATFFAPTWLLLPGFGLIDLSVTLDADCPVVLEAGWGVFMTVLVGDSLTWAGLPPLGSALCMSWGDTVAVLALAAPRLQPRELRREVVETQ